MEERLTNFKTERHFFVFVGLSQAYIDCFKKRHSVILGITRSGKTFFAARILQELQDSGVHTIFVDPKHDKGYSHLGTICYSPDEVLYQLLHKNKAIIYRPPASKEEKVAGLDRISDYLINFSKKDGYRRIRRVIAIDELQLFVKKGESKAIEAIWTIGAGIGIVGMALTQRIQLLNETAWSQSDNKVIFRVEDRADYLRSRNLDHYVDKLDFFQDSINQFYYYSTTGGGNWKVCEPIPPTRRKGNLNLQPY